MKTAIGSTLITNGQLVAGAGGPVIPNAAVLITDGKIQYAGGRLGLGGDYGFACSAHGTYAHELTFFVENVGFSPMETLACATKPGAEIMNRDEELGTLEPGKLADVLIVDGDVLDDISIFEDRNKFIAVF
jgi:imidazolonepropionase-like amidohydrolase